MKTMRIATISTLGIASLTLLLSACSSTGNTNANNSAANTANKANTAVVTNSNRTAANTTPSANTAATPAGDSDSTKIQGELGLGKTESVILYVGAETGDYAAYCFANDSEAGRAILAACKDGDQCEVNGTVDDGKCTVPGLEADLSASGRISKVESAKSLGRKK